MDFSGKSDVEIATLIANYQRLRQEKSPVFVALLAERERRASGKDRLDVMRSLDALKDAAREGRYVTYGDLAKASGQKWSHTLRARMSGPGGHLDRLLDLCHQQGLPLLTAICVNQANRTSGELEEFARSGFANGARRLSFAVGDEDIFYRDQQQKCFAWGRQS